MGLFQRWDDCKFSIHQILIVLINDLVFDRIILLRCAFKFSIQRNFIFQTIHFSLNPKYQCFQRDYFNRAV